jgi:hypothetical protein
LPSLLANILTVLGYLGIIGYCGWRAYQTNHSWSEAAFVSGEVVCLYILILLALDTALYALHSPDGLLAKWRQRRDLP